MTIVTERRVPHKTVTFSAATCSSGSAPEAVQNEGDREMLRLAKSLTIILPVFVLASVSTAPSQSAALRASAQSGSQVTVNGTTYNVTPLAGFLRIDDLDGHMVGAARKDGSVIAPQSGAGFDTVKAVANAYIHSASAAAPDLTARNTAPNLPGNVPTTSPTASGERAVTLLPTGGAIVHDSSLKADVTFNADGTRAEFARQSQGPMGLVSQTFTAVFEGGDQPPSEGKKLGKFIGSGAKAVLQANNTHVTSHVAMNGDEVWKVSQKTNGGKEATLYESGAYGVASAYSARVQDPGKTLGLSVLQNVKADRDAIETAAATAKQAGQSVQVDFSGDRSQRAKAALDKAVQ